MPIFSKALSKMHKGATSVFKKGTVGNGLLHSGETLAAAGLLGYVHGRYRDQASVRGIPLPLLVGVLGKGAVVAGSLMSKRGEPGWVSHADSVANAGLASFAFGYGLSHGTEAAGRQVFLLEKGANAPAQLGDLKKTTVVGELTPVTGGAWLSDAELQRAASK